MKVSLKEIAGPWEQGWALDKHTLKSTYLGDEYGHPRFENLRSEVGEATYQLKYRQDWSQVEQLAQALADNIYPKLERVGFIVPMPASTYRPRQPVTAIAEALGKIVGVPVFTDLLRKSYTGKSLKDLHTKEEKAEALGNSFSINDQITNDGKWNVLLIDDLFHTGASMEAACKALRTYPKVNRVYVAALTWRHA